MTPAIGRYVNNPVRHQAPPRSSKCRAVISTNAIRNTGISLVGGLLLVSVGDRRLIVVTAIALAAHVVLSRGSRTAAAVLVMLALVMALYFEESYREALALIGPRTVAISLVEQNRILAWFCVALAAVYTGAFVLASFYIRRAWRPHSDLEWRQWVALRLGFLRTRITPKAVLYGTLTLLCVLALLAPSLLLLAGLFLHIPGAGRTDLVVDWALSDNGWWMVVITFALLIAALKLWPLAKRHAALGLTRATLLDTRQPMLLLRSFADDTTPLERTSDQHSWQRRIVSPAIWTLEESIEHLLRDHGPVTAVGRSGESLPPTGAAREYVHEDRWRNRIEQLIGEARLVVVILGDTDRLRFEYETLLRLGALPKVILVFPPRSREALAVRWQRFFDVFAASRSNLTVDLSRVLAAYFSPEGVMTVVACHRRNDEDCYALALNRSLAAILSSARHKRPRGR